MQALFTTQGRHRQNDDRETNETVGLGLQLFYHAVAGAMHLRTENSAGGYRCYFCSYFWRMISIFILQIYGMLRTGNTMLCGSLDT